MSLVAGVDSSTQSCTVVIRDAATGEHVRSGRAPHPPGTEVDPAGWWDALQAALAQAGGLEGVEAIAVAGQQHGMVCLDSDGEVVRPALLWNDTRRRSRPTDLVAELGAQEWADATGTLPVASITATKLRWLARHEPENAARTAAVVCLPHDWLTWKLRGTGALDDLVTDRGDASGTGYFSAADQRLPARPAGAGLRPVRRRPAAGARPGEAAGRTPDGVLLGPGTGDNAGAALGLGAGKATSWCHSARPGVVSAVSRTPTGDPTGIIAGFASASGEYLPLVCTLNAARVLDAGTRVLGVDHAGLAKLALDAPAGAGGLVLVPYLEGERTPNKPDSTGRCTGSRSARPRPRTWPGPPSRGCCAGSPTRSTPCSRRTCRSSGRSWWAGRPARRRRRIAPAVLALPVDRPTPGEYVADGAARQAAWVLSGADAPPEWAAAGQERFTAEPTPHVRERYAQARDLTVNQLT
jgi:xylulokinase